MHSFLWAYFKLQWGAHVRRSAWAPGAYVFVNEHGILIFISGEPYLGVFGDGRKQFAHKLDWLDMRSKDWERA